MASTTSHPAASKAATALSTPSSTHGSQSTPGTCLKTAALFGASGPSKATVTERGSRSSRPLSTAIPVQRSETERAMGPSVHIIQAGRPIF